MNAALQRPMSQDEFFAWAERQDLRYEFDGFQPVAMTGGTLRHDRLTRRLHRELDRLLAGSPCEPFGPEAGLATEAGSIRYPDALVSCSPIVDDLDRLVPNPVAVFEVISPTSARIDRIVKAQEYAAVPSILHYVLVESDFIGVTVLTRPAGDTAFESKSLAGDGVVKLPSIGIELPVADIYGGVFAEPEGAHVSRPAG